MASVVKSFAISGIDAYVVNIESDTIFGQPSVTIIIFIVLKVIGDETEHEQKNKNDFIDKK